MSGTVLHVRTGRVLLLHHRPWASGFRPAAISSPGTTRFPRQRPAKCARRRHLRPGAAVPSACRRLQTALDFDVFTVPANERRGEGAHRHYNLRYLFLYDGPEEVRIAPDESLGYRWYPLDDPYVRRLYERIWSRLRQLVSLPR